VSVKEGHFLPEVRGLVGVRSLKLRHQDPEDVDEEAGIGQYAHEPGRHVHPLQPLRGRGQRPAHLVVQDESEEAVRHAGNQGKACQREEVREQQDDLCHRLIDLGRC